MLKKTKAIGNSIADAKSVVARPDYENQSAVSIAQRIFAENFSRYKGYYLMAIVCMVLIAATNTGSAYLIDNVVMDVFEDKNLQAAYFLATIVFMIFFVRGFANFGQEVLLKRISNNIVARYQAKAYEHILKLGVGFFSDTRSAYLVGQINRNIGGVQNMMNTVITTFARDLLTLIGLLAVMVVKDPVMSLGSLLVVPVLGYVISRYVKRIKVLARNEVNVNSRVVSHMVETAQGIPVVKAYTMEKQLQAGVGSLIGKAEKQANSIALINARMRPLTDILAGLAIAGGIAFGAWRVIEQGATPGSQLAFLVAAMLAYEPARRIAAFRVQFEKSVVNARMLYELLDTPPRQSDKPDAKPIEVKKGNIDFDHVVFGYDPNETVLNEISFTAKAGQVTALVGPSGGGKSTIINTLLRFHDLKSGEIRVDGQNIANIQVQSLREQIALVSQTPVMFEGTVAENILFGKPAASREAVIEAAKKAQAHEFIMAMAEGYDSPVGEMGSNLSGGQRQRLSIARAILRDAPILLLDEATSALDNESEKLVQHALEDLMVGRTTIIVAHRLSTIQNADKILVIDNGRICEEGNHNDLTSNSTGIYANLFKLGSSSSAEPAVAKDLVKS